MITLPFACSKDHVHELLGLSAAKSTKPGGIPQGARRT